MSENGLPEIRTSGSDQEYWSSIDTAIATLRERATDESALAFLCQLASDHAEWPVRAAALNLLAERFADQPAAQETIATATADSVDWVGFTAAKIAGRNRVRPAVENLIRISGWPSNFMKPGYARKPVGTGAALVKHALVSILGSTDPDELRRLEDQHFSEMHHRVTGARKRDHEDVVLVPGGPFVAGAAAGAIGAFNMDDTDNPLRAVDLPPFLIDRTVVTNRRYRAFLDDIAGSTEFDHPDQPFPTDHRPAHRHDPRFNGPDHPVVGLDWYDACAFAKWAGGALPSEDEWEKAARGIDGRIFPWGNEWDPARANFVDRAFETEVRDLAELERLLQTNSPTDVPRAPVLPADALPEGASPYGAVQMAGNVWEMTRTNFFTRKDMDPFFKGRRPVEYLNRKEAFHVIRGGTWTSPPVCLSTYYRGSDLLTDKHNEIGFRCVYPVTDS